MGDATALSRAGASQTRQIRPAPTIAPPAECAETSGAHLARERTGHPRLRRTFVGSEDHFETSVQIHTPGGNLLSHRCPWPRHGGTSARRADQSARGARTQHPCSQDAPRSPAPTPPRFSCTPEPRKAALLRLVAASVGDRRSFGTSHGPGRALASVCRVGRAAARHASTSLRGQARVPVPPHPGWHAPFRSRGSRTRDLPPAPTTARGSSRLVRSRLGRAGAATVTTVICAVVKRGHRSYSGETKPP